MRSLAVGQRQPEHSYRRIVETMDLPEYWRIAGWPDYCRPLERDDFECIDPDQ